MSDVERTVKYSDDACDLCLANDDVDALPVHKDCDCSAATSDIDLGVTQDALDALMDAAANPDGSFTYGGDVDSGLLSFPYPEATAVIPTAKLQPDDLRQYTVETEHLLSEEKHVLSAWRVVDSITDADDIWIDVGVLDTASEESSGDPAAAKSTAHKTVLNLATKQIIAQVVINKTVRGKAIWKYSKCFVLKPQGVPSDRVLQEFYLKLVPWGTAVMPSQAPAAQARSQWQAMQPPKPTLAQFRYSASQPRGPDGRFESSGLTADKGSAKLDALMDKGIGHDRSIVAARFAKTEVARRLAGEMKSSTRDMVAATVTNDRDSSLKDAAAALGQHDITIARDKDTGAVFPVGGSGNIPDSTKYDKALADTPEAEQLVREGAAAALIGRWATTSNDSDAVSLSLQETAKSVFSLDNTAPWGAQTGPLADEIQSHLSNSGAVYADFLQTQYNDTQAALKAEGIDTVTVYRGFAFDGTPPDWVAAGMQSQEVQPLSTQLRPLSSFSIDPKVSSNYAASSPISAVIKTELPASQILSYPRTGVGDLNLSEVVAIGTPTNSVSAVYGTSGDIAAASDKLVAAGGASA